MVSILVPCFCQRVLFLELLTDDEWNSIHYMFIEPFILSKHVCPVDTHHTNHREEDTDTHTCRTFQLEQIKLATSVHALPASTNCKHRYL